MTKAITTAERAAAFKAEQRRLGETNSGWVGRLNFNHRSTWPAKMCAAVDAGADPFKTQMECLSNPERWADPEVIKFLPGKQKEFHAITKLAPSKVDSELRQFEGWATRPELDRTDEIVDAKGVTFHNPTVLLLHHDHRLPVGSVDFIPKSEGIWFKARLPRIDEPGELRERVECAWSSVKSKIITSVSVGFRALETKVRPDGVLVYTKSALYELSLVSVPALQSAQIDPATIKGLPAVVDRKGLTPQQIDDLNRAQVRRALGKRASAPASVELVMVSLMAIEARLEALEEKK